MACGMMEGFCSTQLHLLTLRAMSVSHTSSPTICSYPRFLLFFTVSLCMDAVMAVCVSRVVCTAPKTSSKAAGMARQNQKLNACSNSNYHRKQCNSRHDNEALQPTMLRRLCYVAHAQTYARQSQRWCHGLSHVSKDGASPRMVDVGSKQVTRRTARAQAIVHLPTHVSEALLPPSHTKGDAVRELVGPKVSAHVLLSTKGLYIML